MEMDPYFKVPEKTAAEPNVKPATGDVSKITAAPSSSSVAAATSSSPSRSNSVAALAPSASAAPTAVPAAPAAIPDSAAATKAFSLEEANEEIALLLTSGKVSQKEVTALQGLMRDHVALREKVTKLKSLLGRSAKAQREAKLELEGTQKRLEAALREVERLTSKVEKLANRPTHMDLLADFETNFDKALLSVQQQQQLQTGGQDTSATPGSVVAGGSVGAAGSKASSSKSGAVVDSMLMQELAESQARAERLESLNGALVQRSAQLESQAKQLQNERDVATSQLQRAQLELKMAQMEATAASRAVQDKMASLQEMQMEINLVTKASMDANKRAQRGEEAAKTVASDKEKVQQLQLQVQALQEWALASAEAKRLSMERVKILEYKLEAYEDRTSVSRPSSKRGSATAGERKLGPTHSSSMVIGAGDMGHAVVDLPTESAATLKRGERVVLRWKFDTTPESLSIDFSIWKGRVDQPARVSRPDVVLPERIVTGGAGGDQENAFAVQNCCTMVWSNKKSWVRPRTIKYSVDILAIKD